MKKYGFLFGAGAEKAYGLPTGGRLALDIFRQDTTVPKDDFRKMLREVKSTSNYACDWLPEDYLVKNISTFGKTVFQSIIMSTVEHRRNIIIQNINDFDKAAAKIVKQMKTDGLDVDTEFRKLLRKPVSNIQLFQDIAYNKMFSEGNTLFKSHYFSALLMVYQSKNIIKEKKKMLGQFIIAIMQLQLGGLSEELSRNINDNLFEKNNKKFDLFDDFGELIRLNYNAAGVSGLELLREKREFDTKEAIGVILEFTQRTIEDIFASVLDYKSLIDSYWHYLYNPSSDWAKFCKIAIFLFTVRQYIAELGEQADKSVADGYYNMLKKSLDEGRYTTTAIATTNYNTFIEEILGLNKVSYLNGSVNIWYDPYLNKVGDKKIITTKEKHILVPLLYTQSGTKPMTSIDMSKNYVDVYNQWKNSDAIVVVGYSFGQDDEHINGLLRSLVDDEGKEIIVVTLKREKTDDEKCKEIARKLKVINEKKLQMILVDGDGKKEDKPWSEWLE